MARLALIMFSLVAAVSVSVACGQAGDLDSSASPVGDASQRASVTLDDTPVLRIGSEVVTRSQFRDAVVFAESSRARHIEVMRQTAEHNPAALGYMEEMLALIDKHGPEQRALGRLVIKHAINQEVERRGLSATPEEIAERVSSDKAALALVTPAGDPGGEEPWSTIATVGEERYWNELYPATVAEAIGERKLMNAMLGDTPWPQRRAAWIGVEIELVKNLDVTVLDPDALGGATIDGALAALRESQELEERSPS